MSKLLSYPQQFSAESSSNLDTECTVDSLFDGKSDSCWCSEAVCPSWLQIDFSFPITNPTFSFLFQGGFVPQVVSIQCFPSQKIIKFGDPFQNNNSKQQISVDDKSISKCVIHFGKSSDFYGRIVCYEMVISGITEKILEKIAPSDHERDSNDSDESDGSDSSDDSDEM